MNLFNKEKDLILRILNFVLIVVLLISITVLFNGFVNLLVKEPRLTEEQYETKNCVKLEDTNCENNYNMYIEDLSNNDIRYKKQILTSFLITITVTLQLILLNKKK